MNLRTRLDYCNHIQLVDNAIQCVFDRVGYGWIGVNWNSCNQWTFICVRISSSLSIHAQVLEFSFFHNAYMTCSRLGMCLHMFEKWMLHLSTLVDLVSIPLQLLNLTVELVIHQDYCTLFMDTIQIIIIQNCYPEISQLQDTRWAITKYFCPLSTHVLLLTTYMIALSFGTKPLLDIILLIPSML